MVSLIGSWEFGDTVSAAAFSPDTTRVAVGSGRPVWIYDTSTGLRLSGQLDGHNNLVRTLAFSPDGCTLASGSEDSTLRLWDTETGTSLAEPLRGHTLAVVSVIFSLDGRFVISGSNDYTVRVWDAHTGEIVGVPIRPALQARSLALMPGGRLATCGSDYDYNITVCDMDSGAILFDCTGHQAGVSSLLTSPNGRLLASGSFDRTIRFWDPASGQPIGQPLKGHASEVILAGFSSDGRYLTSSSDFDSIRIWDTETGRTCGDPLPNHKASVEGAAFTPDGNRLVSAYRDGTIKIWDLRSLGTSTGALNAQAGMTTQAHDTDVTGPDSTEQTVSQPDIQVSADMMSQLQIAAEPEPEITSATTPEEIVSRLSLRGCPDMTDQLDLATCTERPIASGGFGEIYQGGLKDGTQVAIKTIRLYVGSSEQDQKILKHAAHEVYAWSKCKHPNVQPLLGLVMFHGHIGMIARWESNGSLPQYLERRTDADRCMLSSQVAEGLSYLHASGVVHGDLKGANVLISRDGVAQLADFGNAKLEEYTLKFTKTSTKEALSSRWAAPELFEGSSCSYATDVYALGMTILEAVTGDVPWTGKSERAVMFAITIKRVYPERPETHIPSNSEHGDTLWSLLKSCWEFEPEERPSAANVAQAMRGVTQSGLEPR